jgi:hypothetical protein
MTCDKTEFTVLCCRSVQGNRHSKFNWNAVMQMEANEGSKVQTILSLCSCQSNTCTVTQPTSTVEYCSPKAECFETCVVSPFLLYNACYSLLTLNKQYSRILIYVYKYECIVIFIVAPCILFHYVNKTSKCTYTSYI